MCVVVCVTQSMVTVSCLYTPACDVKEAKALLLSNIRENQDKNVILICENFACELFFMLILFVFPFTIYSLLFDSSMFIQKIFQISSCSDELVSDSFYFFLSHFCVALMQELNTASA